MYKRQQLPAPGDWAFRLDLWQNPYAVARFYDLPLWSEEHLEAMRPLMQLLADAGQKTITASIMHKPWGGQTEDYFKSMVMRVKTLEGKWIYDYAVFDKWVEFMMELGIDRQINCCLLYTSFILLNARFISDHVKQNIGFSIIVKDNVNEAEVKKMQKILDTKPFVLSSVFVSKEEAARNFKAELGEDFEQVLGYNPLLLSLIHISICLL